MSLKYLIIYSLLSFTILGTIGCSKPLSSQNTNQSETNQLYEQGGKYFLGKGVPKDYQKPFLTSKWQPKKDHLSLKMI